MRLPEKTFLLGIVGIGLALAARADWSYDPIAWTVADGRAEALGHPAFAFGDGRCTRFTATVRPVRAQHESAFATMGVAIGTDEDNYWSVQLVARPETMGGQHIFELGEKRQGVWPAHSADRLSGPRKTLGTWAFGETYVLSVELDGTRARGEIRDAAGALLFSGETPFRGKPAVTSGGPMLVQRGVFFGSLSDFRPEGVSAVRPAPATYPPYASDSFVPGVKGRATGFFHVEQLDGTWWVVDPLGRGTVIRGCDGISYEGPGCEALGYMPYGRNNRKTYPSSAAWETNTLARLKAWGFNMLGNCRFESMRRKGLAHAIPLSIGDSLCKDFDDDEYWIGPDLHVPRTAFPNVFHPKFEAYCRYRAEKLCRPNRDDPWLLGYFLDNELAWNGWQSPDYRGRASAPTHVHSNRDPVGGMFDTVRAKDRGHTARQALDRFMTARSGADWERHPVDAKTKLAFLELVAETYFGTLARAIRAADPNHMILGARFDGLQIRSPKVLPEVWRAAGRHCDVLSFNCYPWADLDRNVVRIARAEDGPTVADVFRHFHAIAKRPFLVTEWSFPALDSGLPCRVGAGQRFHTQDERVRASELFARTIIGLPFMVGYDYFKWVDQPALGCSRAFPEDSNYGLVDVTDKPYDALVSLFARLHRDVAGCRAAGVPPARPVVPDPDGGLSAAVAALGRPADAVRPVTYRRNGDDYEIDTGAGSVWRGRLGASNAFFRVTFKDREIGSFAGMLSFVTKGGRRLWLRSARAESAEWDEAARRLTVVLSGGEDGFGFRLTYRYAFAPGRPFALAECVRVENVGKRPLKELIVYFRQHAPYEREWKKRASLPHRPVWKEPSLAGWYAADGRRWSAATLSPRVRTFSYRVAPQGTIHPDAAFEYADAVIAPGEALDLRGCWMLAFPGEGDEAAFRREVGELLR